MLFNISVRIVLDSCSRGEKKKKTKMWGVLYQNTYVESSSVWLNIFSK